MTATHQPTADTRLTDELHDARKHLLGAYVCANREQANVIGALINAVDQVVDNAMAVAR